MRYRKPLFLTSLIFPIIAFSCKGTHDVSRYEYIILAKNQNTSAYTLSEQEQKEFATIICSLNGIDNWVRNAPDMVLLGYREQDGEPDHFSVYLDEGFIYKGFYLDAVSERMHDKKSHCLLLNQDAMAFLEKIKQSSRGAQ